MDVVVEVGEADEAVAVVVGRLTQHALDEVVGEQAGVVLGVGVVGQLPAAAARDDEPALAGQPAGRRRRS